MFRLGKEVLNKSLGTICAILTAVNFYNLSYSQEARPYIFAFLFTALSFTYFIRLVKAPSKKTALYYALFTLLLLYSHYYSLFAVAAQVVLALIFVLQEHGPDRKSLSKYLLTGFIVIAIGYLPCLPFLNSVAQIKSFWIQDIPVDFMQRFLLRLLWRCRPAGTLYSSFFYPHFLSGRLLLSGTIATGEIKNNPLLLSFTIIFTWIAAVLFIPYLRSLISGANALSALYYCIARQ